MRKNRLFDREWKNMAIKKVRFEKTDFFLQNIHFFFRFLLFRRKNGEAKAKK